MAIEQYQHLPGFRTVLLDNGMRATEPQAVTDRVVILGTASDGPTFEPVRVRRPSQLEEIFGAWVDEDGDHNGATLPPAFHEAYGSGARSIYLMRITGQTASLQLDDGDNDSPADQLIVESRYAGNSYNDVAVAVTSTELQIWSREDKNAVQPTRAYKLSDFANYGKLIRQVNRDSGAHDVRLKLAEGISESDIIDLGEIAKTQLTGGDSELDLHQSNLSDYRQALSTAYDVLKEFQADVIVPQGVYVTYDLDAETVDYTDAKALADHLDFVNRNEQSPCVGVIAVQRLENPTRDRISKLHQVLVANPPNITSGEEDSGRYLSIVVAEPTMFEVSLGVYSDTGANVYAGTIASLPPHHATTNTPLSSVVSLVWRFTKGEMDALTGAGFVTFRPVERRGVVVTDDPTAAQRGSDYANLSTVRVVQDIVRMIQQIASPYIGRPITGPRRQALITDIDEALRARVRQGMLNDADFKLYSTIKGYLRGEATVELFLVPPFILKQLTVRIALRAEAS